MNTIELKTLLFWIFAAFFFTGKVYAVEDYPCCATCPTCEDCDDCTETCSGGTNQCSPTSMTGNCPTGQTCNAGACVPAACSSTNPTGSCPALQICAAGFCQLKTVSNLAAGSPDPVTLQVSWNVPMEPGHAYWSSLRFQKQGTPAWTPGMAMMNSAILTPLEAGTYTIEVQLCEGVTCGNPVTIQAATQPIPLPSSLSGYATSLTNFMLTWANVGPIAGQYYKIVRINLDMTSNHWPQIWGSSFTDPSVQPNRQYTYQVSTCLINDQCSSPAVLQVKTPSIPTVGGATATAVPPNGVQLNWISIFNPELSIKIEETPPNSFQQGMWYWSPYFRGGLIPGVSYSWNLRWCLTAFPTECGPPSGLHLSVPLPPTPVLTSVISTTTNSLQVNWNLLPSNYMAEQLEVWRSVNGSTYTLLAPSPLTGSSFFAMDSSVTSGNIYCYKVLSRLMGVASPFSNILCANAPTPAAPTITLTVMEESIPSGEGYGARVNWNFTPGFLYNIERATNSAGPFSTVLPSVGVGTYFDPSISGDIGTTYYYKIKSGATYSNVGPYTVRDPRILVRFSQAVPLEVVPQPVPSDPLDDHHEGDSSAVAELLASVPDLNEAPFLQAGGVAAPLDKHKYICVYDDRSVRDYGTCAAHPAATCPTAGFYPSCYLSEGSCRPMSRFQCEQQLAIHNTTGAPQTIVGWKTFFLAVFDGNLGGEITPFKFVHLLYSGHANLLIARKLTHAASFWFNPGIEKFSFISDGCLVMQDLAAAKATHWFFDPVNQYIRNGTLSAEITGNQLHGYKAIAPTADGYGVSTDLSTWAKLEVTQGAGPAGLNLSFTDFYACRAPSITDNLFVLPRTVRSCYPTAIVSNCKFNDAVAEERCKPIHAKKTTGPAGTYGVMTWHQEPDAFVGVYLRNYKPAKYERTEGITACQSYAGYSMPVPNKLAWAIESGTGNSGGWLSTFGYAGQVWSSTGANGNPYVYDLDTLRANDSPIQTSTKEVNYLVCVANNPSLPPPRLTPVP